METSPQNPPSAIRKSFRNFLPWTPANDLKITLFGIGTPKGWRKAWIFEWTFFLNLGGPETQCDQVPLEHRDNVQSPNHIQASWPEAGDMLARYVYKGQLAGCDEAADMLARYVYYV